MGDINQLNNINQLLTHKSVLIPMGFLWEISVTV